jgi:hypothetical protein
MIALPDPEQPSRRPHQQNDPGKRENAAHRDDVDRPAGTLPLWDLGSVRRSAGVSPSGGCINRSTYAPIGPIGSGSELAHDRRGRLPVDRSKAISRTATSLSSPQVPTGAPQLKQWTCSSCSSFSGGLIEEHPHRSQAKVDIGAFRGPELGARIGHDHPMSINSALD